MVTGTVTRIGTESDAVPYADLAITVKPGEGGSFHPEGQFAKDRRPGSLRDHLANEVKILCATLPSNIQILGV